MTYKFAIAAWDTTVWSSGSIILLSVMSYQLVINIFDLSTLELFILVSVWGQ